MKITDKHGAIWQLVPMVPDEKMVNAGINTPLEITGDDKFDQPGDYHRVYMSMLSAAPDPELPEGLEPVAWRSESGYNTPKYFYHEQIPDRWQNLEELILQSAALAALAGKDAEILEQCRINGMSAERELVLKAKIERQGKLIEQCREALSAMVSEAAARGCGLRIADEALAAIEKETGA
jgi:hypothetical protein